jgi:hypothetical protein
VLVGDERPVIVPPAIVAVLMVGLVKVLLVRVCVPVRVATPVRVLSAAEIVLPVIVLVLVVVITSAIVSP